MILNFLKYLWYFTCAWPCRFFCMMLFQTRAYNHMQVPKKGGFLLLCNHQCILDPMFVAIPVTRQCCFAAKDSLFKLPLFGWFIKSFNAIPIKRGAVGPSAIKQCVEKLKEGYGIIMYPEGTRTTDGTIKDVKPGFGLLARKANVPIVPAVIDGAYECWPRNKKMFSHGKIYMSYGKPIPAKLIEEMGDKQFARHLTGILRNMQNELRIRIGKKPFDYCQTQNQGLNNG